MSSGEEAKPMMSGQLVLTHSVQLPLVTMQEPQGAPPHPPSKTLMLFANMLQCPFVTGTQEGGDKSTSPALLNMEAKRDSHDKSSCHQVQM